MFGIFATLAEFERDLIHERTMAGLTAARARGRTGGRPRLMTRAKLKTAMAMMADRDNAACDIAGALGVSLSTIYAYVDSKGRPRPRARKLLGRPDIPERKGPVDHRGGAPAVPVSFLTEDQERRYGRFAGDPRPEQLARHFHLDDADHAFMAGHRGAHMRLGCAVQLGTVRFLGAFLEDPTDVPVRVVHCLAGQLGLAVDGHMAVYRASGWRWRHPVEIRAAYGYRAFDAPGVGFRLTRWLFALCWTGTDRPSVLFDRATVWLIAGKVLLPGATTLERLVARVRARASERLWRRLSVNVTPAQRLRLEALLVVPESGRRQSPLDRLRNGPVLTSGKELARTVRRLGEVQDLARDLPRTDRLPRSRVLALARFATASKAQAIMRLPGERRVATLLAFVRTLEASAQDDVLDLFDVVVTRIFADAKKREKEARLRSLRDLDPAALVLRGAGVPVLPILQRNGADTATDPAAIDARAPIIAVIDLLAAIAAARCRRRSRRRSRASTRWCGRPTGPTSTSWWRSHASVTRFLPALARTVRFGANPAGRSIMDAVDYLRVASRSSPARHPPTAFVPKAWMGDVVDERRGRPDGLDHVPRRAHAPNRAPPRPLRHACVSLCRPTDRAP